MGAGEKKVAVFLAVVLVVMIAVYFGTQSRSKPMSQNMMAQGGMGPIGPSMMKTRMGMGASQEAKRNAPSDASAQCATGGGESVKTQEFGKAGAKLEIVALLPITHGCHAPTEAELKKAYEKHPNAIHLTIVDLFGPDAAKYAPKADGGGRAVVAINGKVSFTVAGKTIALEKQEGMSYQPSDIGVIIEQQLKS